jgi:hypothetical protein
MKHTLLLAALAALATFACGAAPAAPAPPATVAATPAQTESGFDYSLSENLPPKFFSSRTGIEVEVVYLNEGPEGQGRALCRVRGIPHPLTGKSMLMHGTLVEKSYAWKIRFNSHEHPLLWTHRQPANVNDRGQVRMRLPRDVGALQLEYNAVRSQQIDTDAIIALHKRQVADGTIAKLEELDRDHFIAKEASSIKYNSAAVEKSCGAEIPLGIDWDSVFENNRQLSNGCANAFRETAKACKRDHASRALISQRVKTIECSYGEGSKISATDEGVLKIQIARGQKKYNYIYGELKTFFKLTRTVGKSDSGRFMVIDPDNMSQSMYLGDGKVMHRLAQGAQDSEVWSTTSSGSYVRRVSKGIRVACSEVGPVIYKPVSDARRLEILDHARFEEPLWRREAFGLARDDRGIYYFVDHLQEEFGGKDFKVYIGPRGQLRETTLLDVVDDSHGTIFATKSGKLRLILTVDLPGEQEVIESSWIARKKIKKLMVLPIRNNKALIYQDLGVYDGEYFGTPCEK